MAWIAAAAAIGSAAINANAKKGSAASSPAGMTNTPDFRTTESVFDNSGWNVSFGESKIDSTALKTTDLKGATAPGSGLDMGAGSLLPAGGLDQNTMVYGAAALLALMVWKRRKN